MTTVDTTVDDCRETATILVGLSRRQMREWAVDAGLPAYRGDQLADWVYKHGVADYADMSNLPRALRDRLGAEFRLGRSAVLDSVLSADGTVKLLLELVDGATVECVGLPYPDRLAACISTQVGCPVACPFCATGLAGYQRNLSVGEIVDQVLHVRSVLNRRVSHIVFMGMGEPLLNLKRTVAAARLINEELGIAMRRLTVSTVGIVPAMDRLAELRLQLTLALSLHAPDDALRRQLIPMAKRFPLSDVLAACERYQQQTGRRVTYEYILLSGVNDTPIHAGELARLVRPLGGHVNLIPYNDAGVVQYQAPAPQVVRRFRRRLESAGITVTQRAQRGADVMAACGQLHRARPNSNPIDRQSASA